MTAEALTDKSRASEFWQGVRAGLPVVLAAAPFGMLFGALAVDNGLTVFEATLMSAAVFGGASQMVGIEIFGQKIAPWIVVMSIVAVNFRHVLYSAAVGHRFSKWTVPQQIVAFFLLTDPQYAETERRAEERGEVSFIWYLGLGLGIYIPWVIEAWIGATFGNLIPDPHALGIDFLLPIYFLGLVMDFRDRPLWLPVVGVSAVVSILAFNTVGSPWHVSIGALAGVLLAAVLPPHLSAPKKPEAAQ